MRLGPALLAVLAVGCSAPSQPRLVDAGRLGRVWVYAPARAPAGVVFLFSDEAGWSAEWDAAAAALRARGAAVVGVDLPAYLAALRASDDGCHYLISEIEELSKQVQHDLGAEGYTAPILAGAGAAGTLVYAALAQSPAATVAGAASVDPAPALATRVPLCEGAAASPATNGGFTYAARPGLPGFWRVSSAAPLAPELAQLAERAAPEPSGSPRERLVALVAQSLERASATGAPLRGLPLVELPSEAPGPWMAVIFSGDGGWRDLDKTVGELLAREGVPVVGVDSLRYFWRKKTPEQVAADLAEIIRHYGDAWGTHEVAVIGYSFGAAVVPFAVNRLPDAERARVAQISLLGLGSRAPFQFRLEGWLPQVGVDVDPYRDAPLVLPELQRIDPAKVQCFYGEDEEDTLCRAPELAAAERIGTTGGHHFDGDYPALARRILDGLRRRGGEAGR
jgi:type IV secretory pathway VirJ component